MLLNSVIESFYSREPSSRGSAGSSVNECEHLRRRQFVVALRRQIPGGASFCIRKNWMPPYGGMTALWKLLH